MAKINYKDESGSWKELQAGLSKEDVINTIYPIGSIYMSVNNVTPATLFGGTWEQIEDRFLLSAGTTYTAGGTGGAASHTPSGTIGGHALTVSEIPSHTHTYAKANGTTGSHTLTINEIPAHAHGQTLAAGNGSRSGIRNSYNDEGNSNIYPANTNTYDAGGGQGHTHTIATTSTNTGSSGSGNTHNHSFTGISQNTMPPYLVVYVWKRTA